MMIPAILVDLKIDFCIMYYYNVLQKIFPSDSYY